MGEDQIEIIKIPNLIVEINQDLLKINMIKIKKIMMTAKNMEINMSFDNFNKTYNKGSNVTGVINIGCVDRLVDFTSINLNLTVNIFLIFRDHIQ